jgi:uncharacterized Tic20 family protein
MNSEDEKPTDPAIDTSESAEAATGAPEGDKQVAMLCHLLSFVGVIGIPAGNILGPLVLWLMKKDADTFVDATGKEVLNFQISATIYGIVCFLLVFAFIGVILLPILIITVIIYTIIGAIKASEGELYKYPFTIQFLK